MFKINTANIYLKCLKTGSTVFEGKRYRISQTGKGDKLEEYSDKEKVWKTVDIFENSLFFQNKCT